DFPIQNLPFGVFAQPADGSRPRVGVAIGDFILDVPACVQEGLLDPTPAADACDEPTINHLMAREPSALSAFRSELSDILSATGSAGERAREAASRILVKRSDAVMSLPAEIGDYTDFYASVHHATNVGSMFRPDNTLLPNYKWLPIGYHGRASSIVPSGTSVHRPKGQTKPADAAVPTFGPSKMLDYESELGFFVGRGNALGESIPISSAWDHIFGFCLVNDWSARDVQTWEYQPLGPFLAKNFATTISPWIVTAEAAEPYRVPALERDPGDPKPLVHLSSDEDAKHGGLNAFLEVYLSSSAMREKKMEPVRLSRAPFNLMYWTVGQMLAHHASNGCNMRAGDLLASGTVSGTDRESRGCLLELTWRGSEPITLPTGEERRFLLDGDEVIMKGYLEADNRPRLGFGECRGLILPATPE
ncbi:MAG TPA: fumarylacetoacetase, partial [Gemmatimonadaceae bacterium]|nr:fumarylacetoacetase [Gemmatimonadaceae bacterium]